MNCHNGEEYLSLALESILNQTYSNWELIFFDNKSSDNSVKIIEGKDSRIKIFKSKSFISLYEARNEAIDFCKGEAITFLDVDDWWAKDKLTKQVQLLKKNKNIKIIYSNLYIYDQNKKK